MAFTVNTNVMSLTAQNNLRHSQSQLNTAIERLSSGSKINSAKDDAAGEAISNRMTSQIAGLKQASANANDGISLAQTTEGALDQINDNLQRVRDLTVQAQNGTNSQSDLDSIQDEITQRLDEIDRISEQTSFNGINVLDGSKKTISIQVGSEDGQTIDIDLSKIDAESLSLDDFSVGGVDGDLSDVKAGDDDSGNTVTVKNGTVVDGSGTDVSDTYTLKQDESGNYFATDGTDNFAVSNVSIDADSDAANPTVSYTVDVAGGAVGTKTDNPLSALDNAIKTVDDSRSGLGAIQNRLDSAINNLNSMTNNLSSARSRIEDTDYASEVSAMTKGQILQQAGTAVLSQANQSSQSVLSLLQG
jgi:flagellin